MNTSVQYMVIKDSEDSKLKVGNVFSFNSEQEIFASNEKKIFMLTAKEVESELEKIEYEPDISHALNIISQLQFEVVSIKKAYDL